ncbi:MULTISPECIES: large conductance mechanosensitive channel protein MscL [unclassified Frankia]|uniref:large conductance mechanosensitive channel protein MscL n=1 Tax=unclassified Frankia TaxID=2632575 RepID=UPI0027DB352E|nr:MULTISPECIES: large conductance mechanosensitive channel protein MscL [unclassified Frankia]
MVGFRQFIIRGNVVDLAVAVVMGTAFTAVVSSLVKNIFTPLIAAIFGKPDFSALTFTLHRSTFKYGLFVNDVITFLSVAAVIYFIVVFPLAKFNDLRRRGEVDEPEAPALSDEARLLSEIRDLLAGGARPPTGTEIGSATTVSPTSSTPPSPPQTPSQRS